VLPAFHADNVVVAHFAVSPIQVVSPSIVLRACARPVFGSNCVHQHQFLQQNSAPEQANLSWLSWVIQLYPTQMIEVGRAWVRAQRLGSDFLLHKTQSPSPRFGLGPKPDFFTYVVKPEPNKSTTYLVNFSSPKEPKPKVWSPSPTQAQKIRPNPPLANELH
jgi:hypothetical protein